MSGQVIVEIEDPCGDRARALVTAYLRDVVSRFHGRPATSEEMSLAVCDAPGPELAAPHGVMLVGRLDGKDVGCVGVRFNARASER